MKLYMKPSVKKKAFWGFTISGKYLLEGFLNIKQTALLEHRQPEKQHSTSCHRCFRHDTQPGRNNIPTDKDTGFKTKLPHFVDVRGFNWFILKCPCDSSNFILHDLRTVDTKTTNKIHDKKNHDKLTCITKKCQFLTLQRCKLTIR